MRGTTSHELFFGGSETVLQGYVDVDMVGDKESRRSTTGHVFTVGGTTKSWISKLQHVVSLSTMEAKYVAATEASKEMIWLQRFMAASCTVKTKVPFILQRNQPSILRLTIYSSNTIS